MQTLVQIANRLFPNRDPSSKGDQYYEVYEKYFARFRDRSISMFEIGIFNGDSTKIFSTYFTKGKVVGIDLNLKPIDFSNYRNVTTRAGDQTDRNFLTSLADELAPGGIDIVIDDASHIGYASLKTFEILFDRVKPGGLYIVEDWCTGYWNDWPDGGAYQTNSQEPYDGEYPKRIVSHDFGMVGFVKSLVDQVGRADIRPTRTSKQTATGSVAALSVFPSTVVLEKKA